MPGVPGQLPGVAGRGSIPALKVTQDLGFMLHSLDYSDPANIRSQFFRAKLVDGVMECRDMEVFT